MIQRVQTLYLLLTAAMLLGALFFPWGSFFTADGAYSLEAFSVKPSVGEATSDISFWALGVALVVCAALSLFSIFCFKNRILQARLCIFNTIALLAYYLVFVVFVWITKSQLEAQFGIHVGTSFPLIGLIFNYLALRAILKDEKKVRAYQRIR